MRSTVKSAENRVISVNGVRVPLVKVLLTIRRADAHLVLWGKDETGRIFRLDSRNPTWRAAAKWEQAPRALTSPETPHAV